MVYFFFVAPDARALVRDEDVRDPPDADLRVVFRDPFADDLRDGTLAPFRRASFSPIAIACLRLLTLRPDPLLRLPVFRRRIADSTLFDAFLPYFAM
jgi:hypothetical protein